MLGFKKSITPDELGQAVLSYANDRLVADAYRSLGQRFEGHDASKGWAAVLQANGLSGPTVKLYRMFYTHAALQTHFRSFAAAREIMRGAMANFTIRPAAYDFGKIFDDLEAVFEGRYEFDAGVVPLYDPADQPMSAVLAAKYLVNDFVFPNLPKSAEVRRRIRRLQRHSLLERGDGTASSRSDIRQIHDHRAEWSAIGTPARFTAARAGNELPSLPAGRSVSGVRPAARPGSGAL